jgi:hypothetical protein
MRDQLAQCSSLAERFHPTFRRNSIHVRLQRRTALDQPGVNVVDADAKRSGEQQLDVAEAPACDQVAFEHHVERRLNHSAQF